MRNQKISHERPPAPRSQGGDSTWKHRNTPSPLRAALSLAPPLPPAPRPYWLWPPPLLLLLAAAGSGKLAAAVKPSMAGAGGGGVVKVVVVAAALSAGRGGALPVWGAVCAAPPRAAAAVGSPSEFPWWLGTLGARSARFPLCLADISCLSAPGHWGGRGGHSRQECGL